MKLENILLVATAAGIGYLLLRQAQAAAQTAHLSAPVKDYVPGQFSTANPEYG